MGNYYKNRIYRKYEKDIPFMSSADLEKLQEHERNFFELTREQILELLEKQKTENKETLI